MTTDSDKLEQQYRAAWERATTWAEFRAIIEAAQREAVEQFAERLQRHDLMPGTWEVDEKEMFADFVSGQLTDTTGAGE